MKRVVIMQGVPTHLLLNNRATACGLVGARFAAYDPRDCDCANCMKTDKYKAATGKPLRRTSWPT